MRVLAGRSGHGRPCPCHSKNIGVRHTRPDRRLRQFSASTTARLALEVPARPSHLAHEAAPLLASCKWQKTTRGRLPAERVGGQSRSRLPTSIRAYRARPARACCPAIAGWRHVARIETRYGRTCLDRSGDSMSHGARVDVRHPQIGGGWPRCEATTPRLAIPRIELREVTATTGYGVGTEIRNGRRQAARRYTTRACSPQGRTAGYNSFCTPELAYQSV